MAKLPAVIACGDNFSVNASYNGVDWEDRSATPPGGAVHARDIIYVDDFKLFMMVGLSNLSSEITFYTSPDCKTWTHKPPTGVTVRNVTGIAYGEGTIVCVGDSYAVPGDYEVLIIRSEDMGETWEQVTGITTYSTNLQLRVVRYLNKAFYAAGDVANDGDPFMWKSTDKGKTWTELDTPDDDTYIADMIYVEEWDLLIAVGGTINESYLITSDDDGTTWTEQSTGLSKGILGIAYGNGMAVICTENVGGGPGIARSTNGTSWEVMPTPDFNEDSESMTFFNNLFIIVGDVASGATMILTSSDGRSWAAQDAAVNKRMLRVRTGYIPEPSFSKDRSLVVDYVQNSVMWWDPEKMELHKAYSGTGSPTLDREVVYDLLRGGKAFFFNRGAQNHLQYGLLVHDTKGNHYTYGFLDSGYIERLENGTDFDGIDIKGTVSFGDLLLYDTEGHTGILEMTELTRMKLIQRAKQETSNNVQIKHFGDAKEQGTTFTLDPTRANYRLTDNFTKKQLGRFVYHMLEFSLTTDDETIGFEPVAAACWYKLIRRDKN